LKQLSRAAQPFKATTFYYICMPVNNILIIRFRAKCSFCGKKTYIVLSSAVLVNLKKSISQVRTERSFLCSRLAKLRDAPRFDEKKIEFF
jgi:hypothetical protein